MLRPATATAASSAAGAGTFAWAAPELLLARRVDEAADIYSFGVVLWELSAGEPPPPSRRLRPLEVPEESPAEVAEIIDRCLEEEPRKRPTARELLDFFVSGLAKLDAAAGVKSTLASANSAGGERETATEPLGLTLARVSRASSCGLASVGTADSEDAYALPCGGGTGGGGGGGRGEAPLRRTSAAPREPAVPEEEAEEEEGREEPPPTAAGAASKV